MWAEARGTLHPGKSTHSSGSGTLRAGASDLEDGEHPCALASAGGGRQRTDGSRCGGIRRLRRAMDLAGDRGLRVDGDGGSNGTGRTSPVPNAGSNRQRR